MIIAIQGVTVDHDFTGTITSRHLNKAPPEPKVAGSNPAGRANPFSFKKLPVLKTAGLCRIEQVLMLPQIFEQYVQHGVYIRGWSPKTVRVYRRAFANLQTALFLVLARGDDAAVGQHDFG